MRSRTDIARTCHFRVHDCLRHLHLEPRRKEGQSGPWGRRVLLIALTGWGQREDIERAQSAGFDRHFTKPIDAIEIERLLATARRQDELVGT